jgi:hypothetical protein
LFALDEALRATPARWWGTHKKNITEWVQCLTLLTVCFSDQDEGCEVRYTCQSFPKDHVRRYEESWRIIPKEQWVHKFINTLDTTPINGYLQEELHLATTDWYGMTQNFIDTFLFEIQYPIVDHALQIIREKVFEEVSNPHFEQEKDEQFAPLQ